MCLIMMPFGLCYGKRPALAISSGGLEPRLFIDELHGGYKIVFFLLSASLIAVLVVSIWSFDPGRAC